MTITDGHLASALESLGYAGDERLMGAEAAESSEASARSYVWSDLHQKVGLEAAFFTDGVPLIGFASRYDESGLAGLRKRLWNYGRVPLLIVADADRVEIYDGLERPATHDALSSSAASDLSALRDRFGRAAIEAGLYERVSRTTTIEQGLLKNLRALRSTLTSENDSRLELIDSLVTASIIATYLADRNVLGVHEVQRMCGAGNVLDAISSGPAVAGAFFTALARQFNGDVFGQIALAQSDIDEHDLQMVHAFLQGDDLETGQMGLWPYNFAVLPPDLVSMVYEQLVEGRQEADAAFYTPRFLVDVVFDEVLPWADDKSTKVADLSCGSGAFLTEAFRRLIFRSRAHKERPLKQIELRNILTKQIFGMDKNASAARITVFGLYLALLEETSDASTVFATKLPTLLGQTILVSDSFDSNTVETRENAFDVVVGNPPWKSRLTAPAAKFIADKNRIVADEQLAHAYLWLAEHVTKPGGKIGLLMPAKSTLHNRSRTTWAFRRELFHAIEVDAIYDLSALRRQLFANALAPTAILIGQKRLKSDSAKRHERSSILHAAPRPRKGALSREHIVLAPEEVHEISSLLAQSRPDVWKPYLWGSDGDLAVIDFLRGTFKTLEDVSIRERWSWGQGYKLNGQPQFSAHELRDLPLLKLSSLHPFTFEIDGFFEHQTATRPRSRQTYEAPRVLIKRTLHQHRIAAAFTSTQVAFTSGVIGFGGKGADATLLAATCAILNSTLSNYWHFLTSASWGVERDTVEENEYLAMPIPDLERSKRELAAFSFQAAKKLTPLQMQQRLDSAVFRAYGLPPEMERRIVAFMESTFMQFSVPSEQKLIGSPGPLRYVAEISRLLEAALGIPVFGEGSARDGYATASFSFGADGISEDRRFDPLRMFPRSDARGPRNTALLGLMAGFLVDKDRVHIVKTSHADRWTYDAAVRDSKRIFSALMEV